ncbi:hypothetical conserved protein [Rhizobium etli CFN 42]|uniref:Hypothetical conserved protein n=1 Tax=Rhizobium etli (strain ATCC 51251 / DSM 11541 / JCM 21823 / NBRC 15573 / CFN 42) TaxID=347834 RepID=Q2KBE3_RHIEC|nr:hypothetical conserved protein [Rhizobium etli CFN 42]
MGGVALLGAAKPVDLALHGGHRHAEDGRDFDIIPAGAEELEGVHVRALMRRGGAHRLILFRIRSTAGPSARRAPARSFISHLWKRLASPRERDDASCRKPSGRSEAVGFGDRLRTGQDRCLPHLFRLGLPAAIFAVALDHLGDRQRPAAVRTAGVAGIGRARKPGPIADDVGACHEHKGT